MRTATWLGLTTALLCTLVMSVGVSAQNDAGGAKEGGSSGPNALLFLWVRSISPGMETLCIMAASTLQQKQGTFWQLLAPWPLPKSILAHSLTPHWSCAGCCGLWAGIPVSLLILQGLASVCREPCGATAGDMRHRPLRGLLHARRNACVENYKDRGESYRSAD